MIKSKEKYLKNLPFELTGDQNSKTMIIFLHGWPDSCRLWDFYVKDLQEKYIILNISYQVDDYFGIKLKTISDRLYNTIQSVDGKRNLSKIVVSHDWGSLFVYQMDKIYPNLFDQHIAMDVGASITNNNKLDFKQIICFFLYQIYLAYAYVISFIPIIGNLIATFLTIVLSFFPIFGKSHFKFRNIFQFNARKMNYPYFQLWFGQCPPIIIQQDNPKSELSLKSYVPSSPVVYIYGKDKPFQFHGQDWINQLQSNSKNEVIALNGGHWVMIENKYYILDLIKKKIL